MKYILTLLSISIALIFGGCEQDTYDGGELEGDWIVYQNSQSGLLETNPYDVTIEKENGSDILLIRNFLNLAGTKDTKQDIFTAWATVVGSNFTLINKILDQDYEIYFSSNGRVYDNGNTINITFNCSVGGRQETINAIFTRRK